MGPVPAAYATYARVAVLGRDSQVIAGGCGFSRMSVLRRNAGGLSPAWIRRARVVAHLNHGSLTQLYDLGEDDHGGIVLREYVAGRSLAALPAPSPAIAAAIVDRVAQALAALHAAGVAHGAVHPGNVLLGVDGRVVLADAVASHTVPDDPAADLAALAGLGLGSPAPAASATDSELAAWVAAAGGDPLAAAY